MATKKDEGLRPAQVLLSAADRNIENDLKIRLLTLRGRTTIGPTLIYRLGMRSLQRSSNHVIEKLLDELAGETE